MVNTSPPPRSSTYRLPSASSPKEETLAIVPTSGVKAGSPVWSVSSV
jgi:hypothetical protein